MGHEGLSVVDMIPLLNLLPSHVAYAMIVIVVLMIISILATRGIRKETKKHFIPEGRLTVRTAGEVIVESLLKLVKENMGPRGPEFMMIIGTLALFILVSNVLGMIPGFQSPTASINTTGACALTVFCLTHYYGIREHGIKYLKQFTGPIIWLAPLMIPIELIGHFVRPVSLSIRLFWQHLRGSSSGRRLFFPRPLAAPPSHDVLGAPRGHHPDVCIHPPLHDLFFPGHRGA